jgi:putative SOS response-associated peptidase YedK
MCTRYISPEAGDIERLWNVGSRTPPRWARDVFPRYLAPFIRAARDSATYERELVVGQWSLVPWFAKSPKLTFPTCNARSEELSAKASYKLPWARGQRCIIPAESFFEPCWETSKHVPWRFRRADGLPWGLAGLWNTWTDKETGEVVESYTMLTINADAHPHAPALEVLDVVFRGGGPLPPMPLPPEPFALLVAEALDLGMHRDDWAALMRHDGDPRVHAALLAIWRDEVWPLFVARYRGHPAGGHGSALRR